MTSSGFHPGELAVQERAGLRREASRLEGMLDPARISDGAAGFLAAQPFAVLVAADAEDRLWASPLAGPAGFLSGQGETLQVDTRPDAADPLGDLTPDQPAAVLAIDLTRRRRFRVNGRLSAVTGDGLTIRAEEAYGNCPSYIEPRRVAGLRWEVAGSTPALDADGALTPEAARIVGRADALFLGTRHPERGADASHKGGEPGFVRIDADGLHWPDYPGNNMFNSAGNLSVDPTAAVLVLDFASGTAVQLTGTAEFDWSAPGDGDTTTGRWTRFHPIAGIVRATGIRAI
jgi:predicted pyridoxine 5'-phosphate oxidase superfamily flavin-nucleotide-binding protein